MSKKIYRNVLGMALIIWILCFALFLQVMYSYFSNEYRSRLKAETNIVASSVNKYGEEYLDTISNTENLRITLIDIDGMVLFDNRSDPNSMENHSGREEVQEAMTSGTGESTRYSSTISEKTTYYAIKLDSGRILRLSVAYYSILMLIINMGQMLAVIFISSIILSLALAMSITKSIMRPINAIDFENPSPEGIYEELVPFVNKITLQNRQIKKQVEDLKNEHAQREKMRDEFTANVSHELKTPLTSISGYAEIMRNGLAGGEDIQRFAGKIYDEAGRLILLVDDIMKLSQLDENALPAQKEDVDLYEACAAVTEQIETMAKARNINVLLTGEHAVIKGVDQVIDEMIFNLCDNAIKYNKDGGTVVITVTHDKINATVSVEDTGIGIPEEDFDRIFERFYRVNKSHSKKIGGTGLGLSIVKHGARYHNAGVNVESKLGEGTKISIIFPLPQDFANI